MGSSSDISSSDDDDDNDASVDRWESTISISSMSLLLAGDDAMIS